MAGRQGGVVMVGGATVRPATIGLHGDDEIAGDHRGDAKAVVHQTWIGLRLAPGSGDGGAQRLRQAGEPAAIVGERDVDDGLAAFQRADQRLFIGQRPDAVAGGTQVVGDGD